MSLEVAVGTLRLANPVIAASGTFGFGEPFSDFYDLSLLGAVIGKSVSLRPRRGNPPPRTVETPCGMLNAIGLAGRGLDSFLAETVPWLETVKTVRIVSIFGDAPDAYATLAERLDGVGPLDALEVNLSCPNVRQGGLEFGHDPAWVLRIVSDVRAAFRRPVWAKLSPNVARLDPFLAAAERAGADAVTIANSYVGMAINWRRRTPVLANGTGGLSGPAVKPLALAAVARAARATKLPVVASGGAFSADDILEFLVAGASAVQIGTWHFADPLAGPRAVEGLREKLAAEGIPSAASLIGTLRTPDFADPEPA